MPYKKSYGKKRYSRKATVSKRVRAAPRSMAKLAKTIKAIQLKEQETNYKTIQPTIGALKHDSINEFRMWSSSTSVFPSQGAGDGNRVGDRIYPKGIRVRMCLDVPFDRNNVKVKVYYLPYNSDQGTPTTYGDLFHNVVGNSRIDPIQFKRWKGIKYLGTYKPRDMDANFMTQTTVHNLGDPPANEISANTASIYINKFIPINRKVWFLQDSSIQPSNLKENGSILLLPYATINTASTDNVILSGEGAFTVYYKDI